MSEKENEDRAVTLANQAVELVASGQAEHGSRALREAASLAPEHPAVKAAFLKIQSEDSIHTLQKLCGKFILEQDEGAGKEALSYLDRSGAVPADIAQECLELVIQKRNIKLKSLQDGIVAGLLRESIAAKNAMAKRLLAGTTAAFGQIYDIGDRSATSIADLVLTKSAWSKESEREGCEEDVFQLFLAKLLEVGHDYDGRALKGIARLLAADAERLHSYIDDAIFDAILCSLDSREPDEVRSQATLATAKYLELSGEKGPAYLAKFIPTRLTTGRSEEILLAFSVAAAVFPIVPTHAAALFLTEGFVPSLVPLLDKNKSGGVEHAALSMLCAACVDSACREAIKTHCLHWLNHVMNTGKDDRPGLAAVILAKILDPTMPGKDTGGKAQREKDGANSLVPMFKKLLADPRPASKQSSIEGLAYSSIQPAIKEELANDRVFLAKVLETLRASQPQSSTVFGALTLIDHLTRYLPVLSEEQKRMNQLKAYANASKATTKRDPLDEAPAVSRRCKAVVEAGAVSTFVAISSNLSSASTAIFIAIMLSITRTQALRGTIAQQGGARLLLLRYTSITGTSGMDHQTRRTAAHALARILISVDPSLIFPASGNPPLTSTTRPLLSLITDKDHTDEGPRDLLPIFESLLALTNLAASSPEISDTITRQALPIIGDLLLSNNTNIQRATTELVCNLTNSSAGIEAFADESNAADTRLHVLLALADVEDDKTRRAAGGALAGLTSFEGAVKGILKRERGVEILLELCADDEREIVHRGLVCVGNCMAIEGKVGEEAKKKIEGDHGVEILKNVVRRSREGVLVKLGREALDVLMR
ncbi:MAG: hypothetical protein LQ350_005561 [Teloschistes chrysophthalmus]|nr:MAG: hypothetical protein LQ350_005561 [Niorma chrysophthalma]